MKKEKTFQFDDDDAPSATESLNKVQTVEDNLLKKYIKIFGDKKIPQNLKFLELFIEIGEHIDSQIGKENEQVKKYYKDVKERVHKELTREPPLKNRMIEQERCV